MVQGMGALMDLCPPPDAKVLGDICKPFGVLPSQVTDPEDLRFLYLYSRHEALVSWYKGWQDMAAILARDPTAQVAMPMELIQHMIELIQEAKDRYGG